MGFDTKTEQELELLVAHLRVQVALHPNYQLEKSQLRDCERWLTLRRKQSQSTSPKQKAND